jgi:hypothetical protein
MLKFGAPSIPEGNVRLNARALGAPSVHKEKVLGAIFSGTNITSGCRVTVQSVRLTKVSGRGKTFSGVIYFTVLMVVLFSLVSVYIF